MQIRDLSRIYYNDVHLCNLGYNMAYLFPGRKSKVVGTFHLNDDKKLKLEYSASTPIQWKGKYVSVFAVSDYYTQHAE